MTMDSNLTNYSKKRALTALSRQEPDRVPVDLLATPEVWDKLIAHFQPDAANIDSGEFFNPEREAVMRFLNVDCRVISYDMFCNPPAKVLHPAGSVDWWQSLARSNPNRMWRQQLPDGISSDIWGHYTRLAQNPFGSYEEYAGWRLAKATSLADLAEYQWPEPNWWDFSQIGSAAKKISANGTYHLRFRAGSVFENAWQLRGMDQFMVDLATEPNMATYIMDRLIEVIVENTRRALELAGDLIDMVYFYDDIGAQERLMISKNMWRRLIRPYHQQIVDVARAFGKQVMYHCDGAIHSLIPDLIDLGIDLLNPIQPGAKNMDPATLKQDFGEKLAFHGGIDIVGTLPHGKPEDVAAEVRDRVHVIGKGGGYIMSSSHHIQPDTPIENILTMYDLDLRHNTP
jgi:uroporphyrinogen decarboxylase